MDEESTSKLAMEDDYSEDQSYTNSVKAELSVYSQVDLFGRTLGAPKLHDMYGSGSKPPCTVMCDNKNVDGDYMLYRILRVGELRSNFTSWSSGIGFRCRN